MDKITKHGPTVGGLAYSVATTDREFVIFMAPSKTDKTPLFVVSNTRAGVIATRASALYPSLQVPPNQLPTIVFKLLWRWLRSEERLTRDALDQLRHDAAVATNAAVAYFGYPEVVPFADYLSAM